MPDTRKYTEGEAFPLAVKLLAGRAMTAAMLRDALRRRGIPEEAARAAAEEADNRGYLDEPAYAQGLLRRCAAKTMGRRAIREQMRAAGLSAELIEATLEGWEPDPGRLDAFVRQCLRGATDPGSLRRVAGRLARRGFSPEEIRNTLARYGLEETDEITE